MGRFHPLSAVFEAGRTIPKCQNKVCILNDVQIPFERSGPAKAPVIRQKFRQFDPVGEGVVLLEEESSLTSQELAQVKELLAPLGTVETVPSSQMGIAGTLSGCGPAYAAMFLEALGDAGVLHGLPRDLAYRLAAQMLAGAGKLQLETGEHPGAMKDAVCSPGGTTILGVAELERRGFRGAVMEAIHTVQKGR